MSHTPGPWHVGVQQARRIIYDPTGWAVADATVYHGKESADEMHANARLIAAAPDMLRALEKARQRIEQLCGTVNTLTNKLELGDKVRADDFTDCIALAIAKAQA